MQGFDNIEEVDVDAREIISAQPTTDAAQKKEPIIEFKDEAHAYECLREWQTRLFLDDWIIKLRLTDKIADDGRMGNCWSESALSVAEIAFKKTDDHDKIGETIKCCHERVLVHELLHLKYPACDLEKPTIEEVLYSARQHALIEQMAKSLIMAKYGLDFAWFKNF